MYYSETPKGRSKWVTLKFIWYGIQYKRFSSLKKMIDVGFSSSFNMTIRSYHTALWSSCVQSVYRRSQVRFHGCAVSKLNPWQSMHVLARLMSKTSIRLYAVMDPALYYS